MARCVWAAVLAAACAGCGAGEGRRPVAGSVAYRGAPLDGGTVTFFGTGDRKGPVAEAPVTGGSFALPAAQGLEPGTYRVSVSKPEPGGVLTPEEKAAGASAKAREAIPARHNAESTRTVEVTAGGPNRYEFDLD